MGWMIAAAVIGGALIGNKSTGKPEERKMSAAEKATMKSATEGYSDSVARQKELINPLLDSTKRDVTPMLVSQSRAPSAQFVKDNIDKAKTPFDVAQVYSKANNNSNPAQNTAENLARGDKFARGINAASMGKGFGAASTNSLLSLTQIANDQSRRDQNSSLSDMTNNSRAFRQLAGYAGDRFSGSLQGDGSNMGGQAGYVRSPYPTA